MVTQAQLDALYDAEVLDQAGVKVGPLDRVYLDNATGVPAWVLVRTGWLGGRRVFCPLTNAEVVGTQIRVPYPVGMIKDAPEIPAVEHLTEDEEEQLYDYYAIDEGPAPSA
ncbi:PRC-barrel domain-containing protein [Ornithinimicrobium pratense]|uniref:PRC-barrel domain containing protein n=1 Tax=Ornithinimicrobium pratense TaxID=2593973 RepID=A0A5J6V2Y7_9MICO|nr:PRC-barrel domain-containing protein [Ornithinimicrobium pratense]QFG68058.1 PRC-barrel domain containing protein [Ornithinimicrobium pratense]